VWDQETFDKFMASVEENDEMRVATWLSRIAEDPSGRPEIIPVLEKLLTDKRITMVRTPVAYAEVRWNAAQAIVLERQVQNVGEPVVVIKNTFEPMGIPDILFLLSDSDFTLPGGKDWIKKLKGIREADNLPLADFEFRLGKAPKKLK